MSAYFRRKTRAQKVLEGATHLKDCGSTSEWSRGALVMFHVVSDKDHVHLPAEDLLPTEWIENTPEDDQWNAIRDILSVSERVPDRYNPHTLSELPPQSLAMAYYFYDSLYTLLASIIQEDDTLNDTLGGDGLEAIEANEDEAEGTPIATDQEEEAPSKSVRFVSDLNLGPNLTLREFMKIVQGFPPSLHWMSKP